VFCAGVCIVGVQVCCKYSAVLCSVSVVCLTNFRLFRCVYIVLCRCLYCRCAGVFTLCCAGVYVAGV